MPEQKSQSPEPDLHSWKKIQTGDTDEFSSLFKKQYGPLYQFAGRYLRDSQAAENIVQNVFVNLWIRREGLNIHVSLKSYLYRMVRNQCLNYLKHEKRTISLENSSSPPKISIASPEEKLERSELSSLVHRAIGNLPPQCRQVYLMKRYDQLSYQEIAGVMNISVNTVKTQMKRALKSLFKQLSSLIR